MKMLQLVERMKEPSSWAGVAVLLGLFGVPVGAPELVAQIGSGIAALIAIAMKEKAK